MTRRLLVVLGVAAGTLTLAPSASALTSTPIWKCRASPLYSSVAGNNRVEPIVANGNINTANGADPDRAQCVDSETGAGNTATQLGIPTGFLAAQTTQALTSIEPDLGKAIDQTAGGTAKVENLTIPLGGQTIIIGVQAATSSVVGRCVSGNLTPQLSGTSNVATLTLGGSPINLDGLVQAVNQLLQPLNQIVDIDQNEQIRSADGTSLIQRALRVRVLPSAGGAPLVDVAVAETKVGFNGPVCDPTKQGTPGDGGGVCPPGSTLDTARNVCVIAAGTGGSSLGEIIVGRPFQGPSGGTVVPIDVARRRFGTSPCLGGSGNPKFAIVGTNRNDRITGTNVADRIIGLGGNDKLDGGRGNDCIEGRGGRDSVSGGLGNDRLYGSIGGDALNGGPGTDYMNAGSGNDSINAAYGADRAIGGTGRDFINVATAGPAASVDCGAGPDKVRVNINERRRVRGCEVVNVFTNEGRSIR